MSSSISETGHAVNISNYKLLIDTCSGFGKDYNPSNESLLLENMMAQWSTGETLNKTLSKAKGDVKEPENERALLFAPLNQLITQVMGAVDSSTANDLVKKDLKGIADRIRGAYKREKKPVVEATGDAELDKVSQSHQGFVQKAAAMLDFINLLSTVKEYKPNEVPLKVTSLTTLHDSMDEANNTIGGIIDTESKALLARNRALYKAGTGMLSMAQVCRDYVKSVFGTKAAEYKQVTAIKFRDLPKKGKDKL